MLSIISILAKFEQLSGLDQIDFAEKWAWNKWIFLIFQKNKKTK